MPINITERAALRFGELRKTSNGNPRIEIKAGGCNGFEKTFSWTTAVADDDILVETATGPVVIDSMSYQMLDTATVDYKHDLAGAYFTIEIPEATSTCGCGTSFSL
jgi:iron-sulfur cluster assembly accessory protein